MSNATFVPLHFLSSLNQEQVETVNSSVEVDDEKNANKTHYPLLCFSSGDEEEDDEYVQVIQKPPEKKQRAPSAYNQFIKEEIKRLKIEYPGMTHKQAFSAAAKNWAHNPQSQDKGGEVVQGLNEELPCFGNDCGET